MCPLNSMFTVSIPAMSGNSWPTSFAQNDVEGGLFGGGDSSECTFSEATQLLDGAQSLDFGPNMLCPLDVCAEFCPC